MTPTPTNQVAIIIGAGPAGLTAAWELQRRTGVKPIVLERSEHMGGIARTVNYKGNRIDFGGHRFFSKSERVMDWWFDKMPAQAMTGADAEISYQGKRTGLRAPKEPGPDPEKADLVMLVRPRKSRIYFMRKFFSYPITLSGETIGNLGLWRTIKIGFSYARAVVLPIRNEQNLEQFFINRFGRELYRTFFKSYTEKVWGVACDRISAEWGAQRVKGLNVYKAIRHFVTKALGGGSRGGDVRQSKVETSLIERFLYPKYGPGQMWEEVARQVTAAGGEIRTHQEVVRVETDGDRIVAVVARDFRTGEETRLAGDYFFSTMAMVDLVHALDAKVPGNVREVADGLVYRDFMTVGLLVDEMKVREATVPGSKFISDTWIYIQEPDVKVGRLQIFNNWSPWMIADPTKVWIGMEYFCFKGDEIWNLPDEEMSRLAIQELDHIGLIEKDKVCDSVVLRMEKTYPAYFGTYDRFGELRGYLDGFTNLFLVGRNGMHKYNNQDHSMLTAMLAVENIAAGRTDKSNLWAVNTEQEYHEEKKA